MEKPIVYGMHAVLALLTQTPSPIVQLLCQQERQDRRMQQLTEHAQQQNIPIVWLAKQTLDRKFPNILHQGVVAVCEALPEWGAEDLPRLLESLDEPAFLLLLDGVTDPHNLGACLRSADAAGVHAVIAPKAKAVGLTATVRKVACGAAEQVPFIQVPNLSQTIEWIKQQGIWVYGFASEASQSFYQLDTTTAIAWVMGAEGSGLRRLTRERCDELVCIPMQGSVASLNVSVATGIACFEVRRQRQLK
ncbi:MAG: 23S rRNA (guanosine(2251)-2'-O)-methyltransferase RlmB [Legionellales bacterium]|nr:23S rRNA (guanosine(2251)-2'-O)-methyltransferase RlmB [Legionellales bacterium]